MLPAEFLVEIVPGRLFLSMQVCAGPSAVGQRRDRSQLQDRVQLVPDLHVVRAPDRLAMQLAANVEGERPVLPPQPLPPQPPAIWKAVPGKTLAGHGRGPPVLLGGAVRQD